MPRNSVGGINSYNAICQVCGLKYKAADLRKRWDGLWVCRADFESRHPQDFVKDIHKPTVLPFLRPDRDDTLVGGSLSADHYLYLPGITGNYASTPDSAALSITGDIDIRIKVSLNDWTPNTEHGVPLVYKWHNGIEPFSNMSYSFWVRGDLHVQGVAGHLAYAWSANGADPTTEKYSGVAVGALDGSIKWLRVTHDVDNGAGGNDIKFYTSDDGVTWTQLGATQTTAGVTSLFDGVNPVAIGQNILSDQDLVGKVYRVEIHNGIGGSIVALFDAEEASTNVSSFVSSTGETWTINTSGTNPAHIVSSLIDSLGNGTLTTTYQSREDSDDNTVITFTLYFVAGSTTTFKSGVWSVALPIPNGGTIVTGNAKLVAKNRIYFGILTVVADADDGDIIDNDTGAQWSDTVPQTLSEDDQLLITIRYGTET